MDNQSQELIQKGKQNREDIAQKWKIYIAKGLMKFITSDSPVAEWFPPPEGFYGATFLERNKYLALTPELIIELEKPLGSNKIKRKTLYEDQEIMSKNLFIATHAEQYIYSSQRQVIESLISGRNNPGQIEINHFKKYELPWKNYRERTKK